MRLFLCGDVMTGRGIDQILAYPSAPMLYEPHVRDARNYVELAERAAGPIPHSVSPDYIWGTALEHWQQFRPDLRIVNLETAVTTSNAHWPGKGIHYRMHPANIACLTAAGIDCCCLANNHVLDWGRSGLLETMDTLHMAGISTAGAGRNRGEATQPDILSLSGGRRVLVFAVGSRSSGIPADWAAGDQWPGLHIANESDHSAIDELMLSVARSKREGDFIIVSIHWGPNWGYEIAPKRRTLAHRLIDDLGVDVVHGHSSHRVQAVEFYRGRAILYGCGDFVTDYEGIGDHAAYRGDVSLMFFVTLHGDRASPAELRIVPQQMHRLQLSQATASDVAWLEATLNRECRKFGTSIERDADGTFRVHGDESR